jgi:hypothetical protein
MSKVKINTKILSKAKDKNGISLKRTDEALSRE